MMRILRIGCFRNAGFLRMGVACCVAAWAVVLQGPRPTPAHAQDFQVEVRNLSAAHKAVTIPLDGSVLVEAPVEVARVHVVAGHIAGVEPIAPNVLMLTGLSYGTTQVLLWDKDENKSVLEVTVELDLQPLRDALVQIDPRSNVEVQSVLGNIVLTGTTTSANLAARMTELSQLFLPPAGQGRSITTVQNHLRIAGEQQVLLRCTVAEVNRGAVRRLGINGFLAGNNLRDAFVVNQIGGINPANIGAAADTNVMGDIPFLTGLKGIPLSPTTTLSLGFPRVQMQLFLKAMSDNSLLKILAEPNLVCISGQTASFLAGGEFPIPVPQSTAATAITIEFREFGVKLNFTPVVQAHQLIRLRINPEVSETDFSAAVEIGGFAVPGLTRRSAETTVEVGNGQTIAIAGLLSEEVRAVASRVPGIGDVPILGALFRSVEFRKDKTELVILVTPEIVSPLNPDQVGPVPGQFLRDPSDIELYALGMLEGAPPKAEVGQDARPMGLTGRVPIKPANPADPAIRGPWGFAGANGSK